MVKAGDLIKEARGLYHIKSDPLDPLSGESGCQERKPEPDNLTDLTPPSQPNGPEVTDPEAWR